MLKYAGFSVVFQEVPDEVTLSVNITNCPNRCEGCHSPELRADFGTPLTTDEIDRIIERYAREVTCIAIMGGDADPMEVEHIARYIKSTTGGSLKVAWYSGCNALPVGFDVTALNFVKIGAYVKALGGLKSPTTNQRLYAVTDQGTLTDITALLQRKSPMG